MSMHACSPCALYCIACHARQAAALVCINKVLHPCLQVLTQVVHAGVLHDVAVSGVEALDFLALRHTHECDMACKQPWNHRNACTARSKQERTKYKCLALTKLLVTTGCQMLLLGGSMAGSRFLLAKKRRPRACRIGFRAPACTYLLLNQRTPVVGGGAHSPSESRGIGKLIGECGAAWACTNWVTHRAMHKNGRHERARQTACTGRLTRTVTDHVRHPTCTPAAS